MRLTYFRLKMDGGSPLVASVEGFPTVSVAGGRSGRNHGTEELAGEERSHTGLIVAANSPAIRKNTSSQTPSRCCLNSRAVGYHGESSRWSSQRQSLSKRFKIHTGLLSAPARCT